MAERAKIFVAISLPAIREEVLTALDDTSLSYDIHEEESLNADVLSAGDYHVVLLDLEAMERFPQQERALVRQAGIESLLVLAKGQAPNLESGGGLEQMDWIYLPIDPSLLKIRVLRAMNIVELRSNVGRVNLKAKSRKAKSPRESDTLEPVRETRQRMADLERLKSNLITIISHEFKTPLHLASGYVSLLLDGSLGELPENQQNAIETIQRQVQRLSEKLSDIERIAQLEMGILRENAEPVDVGVVLEQEIQGFEKGISSRGLDVSSHVEKNLPAVLGSQDFLADVFRRIIDNAIHYSSRGGSIKIEATHIRHDGQSEVRVIVSDQGCGIPPSLLPRIFDRFGEFRDVEHHSSQRSGLGLGLAICRHLVEIHGGRISVASEVGQGSTFAIHLPAAAK